MGFKSTQIVYKDILHISYKDDPLKFLLDLEQISLKYFAISFVAYSIIMSWYME